MDRIPIVILGCLIFGACMDPLHDYDECVRIESARCDLRERCRTEAPTHIDKNFPHFDLATCRAYAKENCRVREIGTEAWTEREVSQCISAIQKIDNCTSLNPKVDETENLPACAFIEDRDTEPMDAGPQDAGAHDGGDGGDGSGADGG